RYQNQISACAGRAGWSSKNLFLISCTLFVVYVTIATRPNACARVRAASPVVLPPPAAAMMISLANRRLDISGRDPRLVSLKEAKGRLGFVRLHVGGQLDIGLKIFSDDGINRGPTVSLEKLRFKGLTVHILVVAGLDALLVHIAVIFFLERL